MDVPAAVDAALDGESVAAHVPLRGEDALFVTPTRTLAYRADGLLSDESVSEYPHDAERVTVSEGRRKSKVVLDYGLDGERTLTVPTGKLDDALHPIIAGVLNHADVTRPGETVKRTYRFSELTLIVTSDRLVKHVGAAVWDAEYEELAFGEVTDVGVEEGSVSSQLVLETTGRTQRIKAPNESFRDVRETVEDALFAAHDAESYEAFRRSVADDSASGDATDAVTFDSTLDPLGGRDGDAPADTTPGEGGNADGTTGSADADRVEGATDDTPAERGAEAATATEGATARQVDARDAAASASESTGRDAAASPSNSRDADHVERDVDALREEVDALADAIERGREAVDDQADLASDQADLVADQQSLLREQQSLVEDQQSRIEAQRERIQEQADRLDALRDRVDALDDAGSDE